MTRLPVLRPRPLHLPLPFPILLLALAAAACLPCDGAQEDAKSLVAEFSRCKAGEACQIVQTDEPGLPSCAGVLQCSVALRADANLASFRARVRQFADDYSGCEDCPLAGCVSPAQLVAECDATVGQCQARYQPAAQP